jgi:hypothetical protein
MAEPAAGSRATLGRTAGPEWLRGIAESEPSNTAETTSMDWLRGIADAPAAEAEASVEPAKPSQAEPRATDSGEWINFINAANPNADSSRRWYCAYRKVPSPEAEAGPPVPAAVVAAAAPAGEMDDAQVFDWLEALAAKQGIPAPEAVAETPLSTPPMARIPPIAPTPPKAIPRRTPG